MLLNRLARAFHVFAKSMGRMTAGKDNLARDCEQDAEHYSFDFFHL